MFSTRAKKKIIIKVQCADELTNSRGSHIQLEWLAGVEGKEFLSFLKDGTLINNSLSVFYRKNTQRDIPTMKYFF